MSAHVIKVPDIGEGIAEVELVAWHVEPGDAVAEDQVLADVMTDKATVEIPSPVAGRVLRLGGEVGQMLAVGAELIGIEVQDVPGEMAGKSAPARPPVAAGAEAAAPTPRPSALPAGAQPDLAPASPRAPSSQSTPRADAAPQTSSLPTTAPSDVARAVPRTRVIASPALRARAWELGVELAAVTPSGPGGRILQRDLDAHGARHPARAPMPPGARRAEQPAAADRDEARASATHAEKLVGLRRKIAQKMQESKRRIPHYSYVEEIDVGDFEALRATLNARWGERRGHLTLLPFLIRAIVLAVREVPQVNARFDDEAGVLTRHDAVHAGIATQTDAGLLVPVLRDAQARDLWGNAAEIARLAEAARGGRIVRDELSGSTITITSLGRLGGIVTTPVINHPEVAIVGVNRIVVKPVMLDGAVVARPTMNLSSSFDHRVVDGMHAAEFVQRIRELLEHPATLFVE